MAKSTTGKKDPQDMQTSERRRVSPRVAQNGADETAAQQTRPRRKPAARRESRSDRTIVGAAAGDTQNAGRNEPGTLAGGERQASAEPISRPTAEVKAGRQIDVPHEHIAVRAYHLYLERGGRAGDDFDDWITAERELRERATGHR
jgi:hypothetical protein